MKFTKYDNDGRIRLVGTAVNYLEQMPEVPNIYLEEHFSGDDYYFLDDIPTLRPDLEGVSISPSSIFADNESIAVLTGVPEGAVVTFGSASIVAQGENIELTTNVVGPSEVVIELFPFKRHVEVLYGTAS